MNPETGQLEPNSEFELAYTALASLVEAHLAVNAAEEDIAGLPTDQVWQVAVQARVNHDAMRLTQLALAEGESFDDYQKRYNAHHRQATVLHDASSFAYGLIEQRLFQEGQFATAADREQATSAKLNEFWAAVHAATEAQ